MYISHRLYTSALCWALLATSLDGALCPVSLTLTSCVCDGDHRYPKIRRITCTDAITIGGKRPTEGLLPFPRFAGTGSGKGFPDQNEVVETLSLIYAGLRNIPAAAFGKLYVLHLDLQGNNFQDRISPKAFSGVGKFLRSLNLAWSNVTKLSANTFRGMVPLRNLTLAENRIEEISGPTFQHLRSLRRLSLAGNPISQLPGTIFRYQTTLELLDLGYCRLRRLPWTLFIGLWNLKVLDLRGNKLAHLEPYTFMDLTLLDTLYLGHNPIRRLATDVFHGLPHLAVLRLDESNIENLAHDVFRDFVQLRTLDLSDNSIEFLEPGTLSLPNLEHLSLDGNKLTEFPADIRLMPRLRTLDISYNRITTVNSCLNRYLRHLDFFNLQENRLICDCALIWLRQLRVELERKWRFGAEVVYHRSGPLIPGRCSFPGRLAGVGATSWMDFDCFERSQSDRSLSSQHSESNDVTMTTDSSARSYDGCDGPYGYHDNRIDFRRRKLRHLAYLSRDLQYMYRYGG